MGLPFGFLVLCSSDCQIVFCTLTTQSCDARTPACTRVQVMEPCCGRRACGTGLQSCDLSPSPFGLQGSFFERHNRVLSHSRDRAGALVTSSPSLSPCGVGSMCSISEIFRTSDWVGQFLSCTMSCQASSAAWAACKQECALRFPLSFRVSKKAAEAVSTKSSNRARRDCAAISPAMVASRITLRIRGLAATTAPEYAGRATSTDLLHPIPDCPALSVACCASRVTPVQLDQRFWPLSPQ